MKDKNNSQDRSLTTLLRLGIFSLTTMTLATMLLSNAPLLTAQEQNIDAEALVQESRCYACHHSTQTLIGPSYEAIAARHGSRKELMLEILTQKILLGGGGNWGLVPMVPNEHVSQDQARIMAQWILNL